VTKKRILVITDEMPWGHRSIARAIYGYLKSMQKSENFEVYYAEVKAKLGLIHEMYMLSYRYLPVSNKISGWISYSPQLRKIIEKMSGGGNVLEPKKVVQKIKPDLIISAYWFHSHSLAEWREKEKQKFKLWTVVSDPWSILPIAYNSKIDLHLVYDQIGVDLGIKECNLKKSQILKTGWWTRQEMFESFDREGARKKIGFNDDRPVIFVGGGSMGTYSLTKILPALMSIKKHKAGLVFNTGKDKKAYNLVEQCIKSYKEKNKKGNLIIKNLGWIENMGEVLAGVDMVFGKAGPNFLFETVALRKPFVAITHNGGQEDGNIDLIKKKGLGWVKEKKDEAVTFMGDYLEDPGRYQEKFKKNIEAEAKRNKKSMEIVLKRVKKEWKKF
jgi:UDP-N-acetylglucosamine:LPS N-acetylglucosamine transferase